MSHPNAQFSLPPGDRDDAACSLAAPLSPDAGRDAEAGGLLPGAEIVIDTIDRVLNRAAEAMSDLKSARAQNDWAQFEEASKRLVAMLRPDPFALARNLVRTVAAERPRKSPASSHKE